MQKQQTTYSTIKPVKVVALQDPQEYYDFFKIVGQNAKKAKIAKNACQNQTSITNPSRVGGRRCSPPGGVSFELVLALNTCMAIKRSMAIKIAVANKLC